MFGGAVAGLLVGGIVSSRQLTERLDTLDNSSYVKKLANRILIDKYPMAVADTMDQRKKAAAASNNN